MELTKEDIAKMIVMIKSNYSYAYKDVDSGSMELLIDFWFNSLSKYDKRVVMSSFQKALETCKMPPTLADIIGNINDIKTSTEQTDTELWTILTNAVDGARDAMYYYQFYMIEDNGKTQHENAKDRFDKIWDDLPDVLKKYCGNKNGLVNLAEIDLNYEKGRFMKTIQSIRQYQEIEKTTNPEIIKLVNGISNSISYDNKK